MFDLDRVFGVVVGIVNWKSIVVVGVGRGVVMLVGSYSYILDLGGVLSRLALGGRACRVVGKDSDD